MGNEWNDFKDEIMGEIRKLRRRIKTLGQTLRFRQTLGQFGPDDFEAQRIILGHMHALPEPWPRMWRGAGEGTRMSSIPDRFEGWRAEEEPITGWHIADSDGGVLRIIHVDGNQIEADIAAHLKKFEEKNPGPSTEEYREVYERSRKEEERSIRHEVWTASALEAARTVFPICDLQATGCGYNIVL